MTWSWVNDDHFFVHLFVIPLTMIIRTLHTIWTFGWKDHITWVYVLICTFVPLYTISAPVCAALLIRLSIGPKMHQWKGCGDQKQMLQWWENRHMLINPVIRGFLNCRLWQNSLRYSSHPLRPMMQCLPFNHSYPVD